MPSDLVEFVSDLPGFRALGVADVGRLLATAKKRKYKDGATIFRRGDPGDTLLVITQGRARVPLRDKAGDVTGERYFTRGSVLGEIALLLEGPRTADVIAVGEVRGLVLGRAHVMSLIQRYPPLARFLTELLGERLERSGLNQVGKYTLLGTLGKGATSRVYSALHPTLGRTVALKMLSHGLVLKPGFRESFMKEARTIASLDHPNIVRVYDVEEQYGTLFLVMEQIRGTTLTKITAKAERRLDATEALHILRQLAAALRHAHSKGVVHRDVKPANVAVDKTGRAKLMDFGIAQRVAPGESLQENRTFTGTPRYMAPEYVADGHSDAGVDIYALGVIGFEMVAGRRIYQVGDDTALMLANRDIDPPDLGTLVPSLPEGLVTFVREALRKDPARRISDWPRIETLLGVSHQAAGTRETIVRVRYPASQARLVQRLIEPLLDELAMQPEMSVAVSELKEHVAGEQSVIMDDLEPTESWIERYM